MNCDCKFQRGRIVGNVTIYQGHDFPPVTVPEITGICPKCGGTGIMNCCEGDREQAMLHATNEVNPN